MQFSATGEQRKVCSYLTMMIVYVFVLFVSVSDRVCYVCVCTRVRVGVRVVFDLVSLLRSRLIAKIKISPNR